jgi:hypothetical protein
MKLGKILKYAGIIIGAIALFILVMSILELLLAHWINLIVLGISATVWCAGAWLEKKGK